MSNNFTNHEKSLSGDLKQRYIDKIAILGSKDPYFLLKDPSTWTHYMDYRQNQNI